MSISACHWTQIYLILPVITPRYPQSTCVGTVSSYAIPGEHRPLKVREK